MQKLDDVLTTLNGSQIMLTADKPLTYRSALISVCETYQGEAGTGNTLRAYNIGIKIIDPKSDLSLLSDEDKVFLKKIVEENRNLIAVVAGRLLEFINKSN